jgi:outer membrane protein assembly factor BamB
VADGRVIIPGSDRVLAVDAYNGTQLWDVGLADSRRVCGPRTTSHLALDDRSVYAAAADQCWQLDLDTGAPRRLLPTPQLDPREPHDWGYLAAVDGRVIGTGARPGALRREMNRSAIAETYYDDRPLQTSDYLFCLDPITGRPEWTYRRGVIIDTTIAIAAGRLYLIAVPTSPALDDSIGRTPLETLCRGGADLLCLDLRTGKELYRVPVDASHWRNVLWTACADGVLVATGSSNREARAWYYLTAFDAASGHVLWQADHPNNRPGVGGGHGEQDHHPVISAGVVYAEPVA